MLMAIEEFLNPLRLPEQIRRPVRYFSREIRAVAQMTVDSTTTEHAWK
jgi:hypothetical protein